MLGVIVCDESSEFKKLAVQEFKNLIAYNDLNAEVVLVTGSPEEMLEKLEGGRVFLLMLDLYYGNMVTGADIAIEIRKFDRESYIVFSTEHTELMHMIFKGMIRPAGFLKKPVSNDEISSVFLDAYRDYMNNTEVLDSFTVNVGTKLYKVPYKKIMYFEASEKKILLCTNNQRISFHDSLEAIGKRLSEKGFLRCHKGFVINKLNVDSIDFSNMLVHMTNEAEIPLSRTYKDIMRNEFMKEK